jgi:hypothetical protein
VRNQNEEQEWQEGKEGVSLKRNKNWREIANGERFRNGEVKGRKKEEREHGKKK